ncbi:MAG: T9SS type A sorting domain-containing protein [Flavobacteriales bacterium]|nr:T9SS type A sorting domain-containing protein [Flavobacteriales bacterium]
MLRYLLLPLAIALALTTVAQSSSEKAAVRITATVQATPSITLNWASLSGTTSLNIYRKLKSGTSWGSAVATPSASALTWTDNSVAVGTNYEYKIVRVAGGVTGIGYISTGIQLPAVDQRGKIILLVDNTLSSALATELTQLTNDLKGDGWVVLRSDVSRTATVTSVKSVVQGHYNSDPTNVKALYIIGHVPVPYSGNIYPDGHDDARGARPTDGYYGDVNGTWTDNSVNVTVASQQRTWNVPGDGKFDQSDFPSAIELQVGRVDMYDMPAFSSSEVELMRSYLNRAHNYKVKNWAPTSRALLVDKLEWLGNPVGASGWRASAMVGLNSPVPTAPVLDFRDYVNGQSYLWTAHYGGGQILVDNGVNTYNGTDGGVTTQQLASSVTMGGVFNMALGSFFLDWDSRNNLLRAIIARGDGLTNCWAGIPSWYFHHMGMGENIGYGARETMNNTGLYLPLTEGWQSSIGRTHLNLMGDPSLRMKMVKPPTNLTITNSNGTAAFAWTAAAEAVAGYHIYRVDATGAITRLTTNPVTTTTYANGAIPFASGQQYMVRAVQLEVSASGSYYNLSIGALGTSSGTQTTTDCLGVVGGSATVGSACNDNNACTINDVYNASCQCVGTSITPSASISASGATSFCTGGSVVLTTTTGTGLSYVWKRGGVSISGATGSSYTATQAGAYSVTVTNSGCATSSAILNVSVNSAPTATITAGGATTFCAGGSVALNANTGTGYTYVWRLNGTAISGATASTYNAAQAGSYTVIVSNGGCATTSSAVSVTVNAAPTATINAAGATSFCTGGSVVLNATTGTGYTYIWKRDGTTVSGATSSSYTASLAGTYAVTITSGGCSVSSSGVAVSINAAPTASITANGATTFCNGSSVTLGANTGAGYTYVWKRAGTTISGATSSSYSATQAGSYTVVVSNGGCSTTSNALTLSVNATPTATLTAAGSTSFCSGGSVALNANTGTGYTYVWRRDGTVISGATSSSYTASSSGSYTVAITSGGCSTTSNAISVSAGTGTGATPTITALSSTSFCYGGNVILTTAQASGNTYQWRLNGVAISGAATSYAYTAYQSGAMTVTVTNGSCSATSAPVTITVSTAPTATITATGPTTFCSGGSVTLSGNTGTGFTYSWSRNGTVISGASASTYAATLAGSYTRRVTNGGCSATSSALTVTVSGTGSTPIVTTSGSASLCTGSSVVLSTSTGTGYAYSWRRDGNVISGATGSSYTANQAGSYTVSVTSGGCTGTSVATVVTVNAPPAASCSSNATAATVGVTVSGGLAPYTYSWNTSPVQSTATATVTNSGTYSVVVTDARGCTASCSTTITVAGNSCTGTRTETQAVWGSTTGTPATYLANNFVAAFPAPNYLTIGCGSRLLRLTSASAVAAFLPSTGSSARLPSGTMVNPTTYSNALAGELVALKLSVRFDELNSAFSPSSTLLKDMVITSGTFAGWTVQELIDASDAKVGNCGGLYGRTTLAAALAAINTGYAGGTTNNGYLQCPGGISGLVVENSDVPQIRTTEETLLKVAVFPNPAHTTANLQLVGTSDEQPTTLEIHSLNGTLVEQRQLGILADGLPHRIEWNVQGLSQGVFLYRIISGDRIATGRIVVE